MKIFYSWQSDLSANNKFIYECLQEAVSVLNTSDPIERAERDDSDLSEDTETEKVILDKDTEGVTGSPEIINTILEKISQCDIYVADITFVGTRQMNGRMLSNPNVLIETVH